MKAFSIIKRQASFFFTYALQSLAIVLIAALLIRAFLLASYVMSGAGMLPSVLPGDFVLAVKIDAERSKRGSVVAIQCPTDKDRICMKRVVGIEGDRIEFQDGDLVVNGRSTRDRALSNDFIQEVQGSHRWVIWASDEPEPSVEPVVVPPGHVFLLNDKRSDREDSRRWGVVPSHQIEARVRWIWLSLEWTDGESIRSWPRVRWSRMLRSID